MSPPPRPPPPRTKWTRRVPHPVLIGHAASLGRLSSSRSQRSTRSQPRPPSPPPTLAARGRSVPSLELRPKKHAQRSTPKEARPKKHALAPGLLQLPGPAGAVAAHSAGACPAPAPSRSRVATPWAPWLRRHAAARRPDQPPWRGDPRSTTRASSTKQAHGYPPPPVPSAPSDPRPSWGRSRPTARLPGLASPPRLLTVRPIPYPPPASRDMGRGNSREGGSAAHSVPAPRQVFGALSLGVWAPPSLPY